MPRILDAKLLSKLADKLGKNGTVPVNKLVSARAARLGISSEAALVLLAKENGIGASLYQRKLDAGKQAEIRAGLSSIAGGGPPKLKVGSHATKARKGGSKSNSKAAWKAAVNFLMQDPELRSRCGDILLASGNFDRPVNQATLVLEDRIRKKAAPPKRMVGENLVNYAFKEEIAKSVLTVQGADPDDQRGFTQILRGVVPALRNRTHHHLTNTFSREEAFRVCGFIDVLLRVVDSSTKADC